MVRTTTMSHRRGCTRQHPVTGEASAPPGTARHPAAPGLRPATTSRRRRTGANVTCHGTSRYYGADGADVTGVAFHTCAAPGGDIWVRANEPPPGRNRF